MKKFLKVLLSQIKRHKKIVIIVSIFIIIALIVIFLLLTKKSEEIRYNTENFTVEIIASSRAIENSRKSSLTVQVDNNNIYAIDKDGEEDDKDCDKYYLYNGDIIESLIRKRDNKILWVYEKNRKGIKEIGDFTVEEFISNAKQISIDILNEITKLDYEKNGTTYKVKLDSNIKNNIMNLIDKNLSFSEFYFGGKEIIEIDFETLNNEISQVKVLYSESLEEDNDFWISPLVFKFSNWGKTKVELTNDIKNSLKETSEGSFFGNYINYKKCPNGETYEEKIELTDEFDFVFGDGWNVNTKIYDCESGYYTKKSFEYDLTDNIVNFYDVFGKVVGKFKFEDNKLVELDDDNNVVNTFNRE